MKILVAILILIIGLLLFEMHSKDIQYDKLWLSYQKVDRQVDEMVETNDELVTYSNSLAVTLKLLKQKCGVSDLWEHQ